ncbi:MAG: hypothetical protein MUF01_06395 [Bryobacterales bacterium]|nr:hypothetical protein [Bryobacterales bacterium]
MNQEFMLRPHPEYVRNQAMFRSYHHLYHGGDILKRNAGEYLSRRLREPHEVYEERLSRVFYENYIGSIIDWYGATLFRREPIVTYENGKERGGIFFGQLLEDCDRKGTAFGDFLKQQFTQALVYGRSYTLVDFPRQSGKAANQAEEDALGFSRAYLTGFTPEHMVNWAYDELGRFEWVVFKQERLVPRGSTNPVWEKESRWYIFGKQRYQIFRAFGPDKPELLDEGLHGFAALNQVPVFEFRLSDGLWLMNKAALLQLEHFNKSNAQAWAISMGLFSMPVIYSDREWKQVIGESYYLKLGADDRFGWTEPQGRVYEIAAENLKRLKEEIYRVSYLLNQAGGPQHFNQSGLSKQRDFTVTQEVLRGYGDAVKDFAKRVLRGIDQARNDELEINVSGLDEFDIGDFTNEIEDARKLLGFGIRSDTLRRQVYRRLTHKYLCDVRQDIKDRISSEINTWLDEEEGSGSDD